MGLICDSETGGAAAEALLATALPFCALGIHRIAIPRMPGLGAVNWNEVFSGLYRAGYNGPVIIEHEDRRFEGTDAKVKQGFLIARDVLRPYCR